MKDFKPSCEICGKPVIKEPHHIITVGAYGGRKVKAAHVPENLIWLCSEHHTIGEKAVHRIGRETFFNLWGLENRLEMAKAAFRVHNGGSK